MNQALVRRFQEDWNRPDELPMRPMRRSRPWLVALAGGELARVRVRTPRKGERATLAWQAYERGQAAQQAAKARSLRPDPLGHGPVEPPHDAAPRYTTRTLVDLTATPRTATSHARVKPAWSAMRRHAAQRLRLQRRSWSAGTWCGADRLMPAVRSTSRLRACMRFGLMVMAWVWDDDPEGENDVAPAVVSCVHACPDVLLGDSR